MPPPITAYILLYISVTWRFSAFIEVDLPNPDYRAGKSTPVFCCSDWRSQKISKSYAPKYLDGKRIQTVDTYYSAVGILDELTPEEMEEVFQKSLAERKKTETA